MVRTSSLQPADNGSQHADRIEGNEFLGKLNLEAWWRRGGKRKIIKRKKKKKNDKRKNDKRKKGKRKEEQREKEEKREEGSEEEEMEKYLYPFEKITKLQFFSENVQKKPF